VTDKEMCIKSKFVRLSCNLAETDIELTATLKEIHPRTNSIRIYTDQCWFPANAIRSWSWLQERYMKW